MSQLTIEKIIKSLVNANDKPEFYNSEKEFEDWVLVELNRMSSEIPSKIQSQVHIDEKEAPCTVKGLLNKDKIIPDILIKDEDQTIALELKLCAEKVKGNEFKHTSANDQYVFPYAILKDCLKLELLIKDGVIDDALAIAITNNSRFYNSISNAWSKNFWQAISIKDKPDDESKLLGGRTYLTTSNKDNLDTIIFDRQRFHIQLNHLWRVQWNDYGTIGGANSFNTVKIVFVWPELRSGTDSYPQLDAELDIRTLPQNIRLPLQSPICLGNSTMSFSDCKLLIESILSDFRDSNHHLRNDIRSLGEDKHPERNDKIKNGGNELYFNLSNFRRFGGNSVQLCAVRLEDRNGAFFLGASLGKLISKFIKSAPQEQGSEVGPLQRVTGKMSELTGNKPEFGTTRTGTKRTDIVRVMISSTDKHDIVNMLVDFYQWFTHEFNEK